MIDLVQIALTKAVEFGIGKILDVMWTCSASECREVIEECISNVSHNSFNCTNCSKIVTQFTNACPATIHDDNKIAHVGLIFTGVAPYRKQYSFFGLKNYSRLGWVSAVDYCDLHFSLRCVGLSGRQLISRANVSDFHHGNNYFQLQGVTSVGHSDQILNNTFQIPPLISGRFMSAGLLAIDAQIETAIGDILCKDRYVLQPRLT